MAKSALLNGRTIKVENRSGFDKSRLNLLTTGVGTITPIVKQLLIPSSGKMSVKIHAELPPLATDAFLRSHLKLEAFFVPLRICYGGFQSWFTKEELFKDGEWDSAQLPYFFIPTEVTVDAQGTNYDIRNGDNMEHFGPSSLTDYFDFKVGNAQHFHALADSDNDIPINNYLLRGVPVNIFPYIAYHLIYDNYYRNKSVSRPLFSPPDNLNQNPSLPFYVSQLPYVHYASRMPVVAGGRFETGSPVYDTDTMVASDKFVSVLGKFQNGVYLDNLHQRNYGDDYFTAARPSAQQGSPVEVRVNNGRFTIQSLRVQNALQEFAEVNGYASPDYVQTIMARYGVSPSSAVVQKPVFLGSADFPMFTKGVEMTSDTSDNFADNQRNPFTRSGMLGATAGRAYANGSDFVCDWDVKEPGYLIVNATLVPEANYAYGMSKDMSLFTTAGAEADLPVGILEGVGDEPIFSRELKSDSNFSAVFGYVQRYLWHKIGNINQIHGLFLASGSLSAFAPQRVFGQSLVDPSIDSEFLEIPKTALDNVAAVSSGISDYGVMMDCAIEMFVSEPLSESALPSLVDPAKEHGKSVYVKNGGSSLA